MTFARFACVCALTLLLLLIGGGAGFLCFVQTVSAYNEPAINDQLEATEAVVVLTGGSERLSVGLNVLRAGKAQKLLISGVHPGVKVGAVLAHDQTDDSLKECCIVLGHEADNTIGNANETLAFMRAQGFHSLRLVTANYHMPRSLSLFSREMPDIKIIPTPVAPDSVDLSSWWHRSGTLSLLAVEYTKFLFAWVRQLA